MTSSDQLRALLKRARIPSYYVANWFRGVTLLAGVLYIPDRTHAEAIARLFGGRLKHAAPTLQIKATKPPDASRPALAWAGALKETQPRLEEE